MYNNERKKDMDYSKIRNSTAKRKKSDKKQSSKNAKAFRTAILFLLLCAVIILGVFYLIRTEPANNTPAENLVPEEEYAEPTPVIYELD